MTAKGNILKDSYYKERLSRTSGFQMNGTIMTRKNVQQQSDTDEIIVSAEEQALDYKKLLSNFCKTADGSTYAFLDFICTHKKLPSLSNISTYKYLQKVDLSFNNLRTLKHLSGLKYLTSITAINNKLTKVLDIKETPLHLDNLDLSSNQIVQIANLDKHKYLRVLKLKGNKITKIQGINKNKNLQILDLSENVLEEIQGLDNLQLTELYLSNNQIETVKGLSKLERLRVVELSINKISKISGLVNLVSLRSLNLAKNKIKNIRQVDYLENLMYLEQLDICYNPIQQRKYYRLQILYKLPMLKTLDGTLIAGNQVVEAESLYGLNVEEKYNIFRNSLQEEEFVDRRINRVELIEPETDSDGQNNQLVDGYDEQGRRTNSNSRSKGSRGFNASKRSNFSKHSKTSKKSSLSRKS